MKPEELRRYEEEFKAIREMLGAYYLELGLAPSNPNRAAETRTRDEPPAATGPDMSRTPGSISRATSPSGHR